MARDPKYDVLFEPVQIGPKTARNRFFSVPHCCKAGSDDPGSQAAFRAMKAEGGWAVVCTEYCAIAPEADDTPYVSARLWDEGDVINLRHMAESVKAHGSLAGVQLHYGGSNHQALETLAVPRAATQLPNSIAYQSYAHECDEDDIKDIIALYGAAARRAEQAGFDYIEVIGSDTHLPIQFLTRSYNRRTDKYGGSFENRARFWLEVLAELKHAVGAHCAVGNRIAIDSLQGPDGLELEEGIKFVELVTKEGLCDLWDVKISNLVEWGNDSGPSRFFKAGHQGWAAKAVKEVSEVPVVQVGRLTSPDDMVRIIREGEADFIGGARPSIADPFLPKKIEQGSADDIRECIGCNICISRFLLNALIGCTQNATAMEEYRRGWHPEKFDKAKDPCSVLVVGGGPAGMECTRVLGLRGYAVHLREAEAEIGGHMRDVMRYPGLAEWGRVIAYRRGQLEKLENVEIHAGVGGMTAGEVLGYGADKVVLAVGAHWITDGLSGVTRQPIDGVDASSPRFCTPSQIMGGKEVGDRVIVIDSDGYYTGTAMAEMMADAGKDVSIVTPFAEAAPYTTYTLEAQNLQRLLHEKGIRVYPLHWVESASTGSRLRLELFYLYRDSYRLELPPSKGEGPRRRGTESIELECDSVVLVTGRRSNSELFGELKRRQAEWDKHGLKAVYQAGDCYAPRLTQQAIFDGHRIAREFESPDPQRPLPQIRERQIWGQETFAKPYPAP